MDPLPDLLLPLDEVDEVLPLAEVGRHGVDAVGDLDLAAEPEQVTLQLPGVLVRPRGLGVHLFLAHLRQPEPGPGAPGLAHYDCVTGAGEHGEVVRGVEDAVEGEDLLPQLRRHAPQVGRLLVLLAGGHKSSSEA